MQNQCWRDQEVGANECVFVFTVDVKIVEDGTEKHITDGQASVGLISACFMTPKKFTRFRGRLRITLKSREDLIKRLSLAKIVT